jgi:hypothetical protein
MLTVLYYYLYLMAVRTIRRAADYRTCLHLVKSILVNVNGQVRSCSICFCRLWICICMYPVLRIYDILVWIWIRGSTPLTNGSGSRIQILLFSSLTFKMPTKTEFKQKISAYYFLKVPTFTSFFKDKSKRVTK